MSHYTYEIELDKECPRCESKCKTAIVSVYHFGATHQPSCKNCGLKSKGGDRKELAESTMINCFYEYEESHQKVRP